MKITEAPKTWTSGLPKYTIREWADGQWREATQGEDYEGTTETFRNTLNKWASRNRYRLETRVTSAGVSFRLTPKPPVKET